MENNMDTRPCYCTDDDCTRPAVADSPFCAICISAGCTTK